MIGGRRSPRRLAMPALVLALLVSARAISLCCLDVAGAQAEAARHATHGSTPHHRSEGEPASGPALAILPTSDCVVLTTPVPALRERGRSGDAAPGVGDPPLALAAGVGYPDVPDRPVRPSLTSVSRTARAENPHPLRL
ncbi:MAG: hypothetical protein ACREK3_09140 [Gemmatimonadota bacterium]